MRWDFTPRRLKFWVEAKHFISSCSLWLERANFWSGVWRTTIAPRCPQSSEQGHKESDMCSHSKSNTVSFSPGLWISIYHSCLNLRDWKCHKRSTLCSLYIPPKLLKVMKGVVCIFYLYLSFQSLSKFSNDFKFTGPGGFHCSICVHFVNEKEMDKHVLLTPTWFEHATFWSGVRRATVAPRGPTCATDTSSHSPSQISHVVRTM